MNQHLFCDGGVYLKNPSITGGSWAWCLADDHFNIITFDSGFVAPDDMEVPTISNNLTELFAALRAISHVPSGWKGTVHTDSKVTLHRLTGSLAFRGIPEWMQLLTLRLRRTRHLTVRLIGGHPTKVELAQGFRKRNGLPVHPLNVLCDELCCKAINTHKNKLDKAIKVV